MTIISPYHYSWSMNNNMYKITSFTDMKNKLGATAGTFAFVIADYSNQIAQDVYNAIPDIQAFQQAGGTVTISFGGANAPYLQSVQTQSQLVSSIADVLNKTGVRSIDFDIEGAGLADTSNNDKLNKAVAQLQQQYPGLKVSYTIPVGQPQWGAITADGINLIKNVISNGIVINFINGMTMDLGLPSVQWGTMACSIAESMHEQLQSLFPNKSSAEIYQLIGITPMIGKNDDGSYFQVNDAAILATYAKQNGIGLLSFWAIERDQKGQGDLGVYSQVNTEDFQFFNTFNTAANINNKPKIQVGTTVLNHSFYQDPKASWLKADGIVCGESQFGYKSILNKDVGQLLDLVANDQKAQIVSYNWAQGVGYVKTGYDLTNSNDSSLKPGFTCFSKK